MSNFNARRRLRRRDSRRAFAVMLEAIRAQLKGGVGLGRRALQRLAWEREALGLKKLPPDLHPHVRKRELRRRKLKSPLVGTAKIGPG